MWPPRSAVLVAVVALLAGCTVEQTRSPETPAHTETGEKTTPLSRYTLDRDRAPLESIGPEDVTDAELRADPILSLGNRSPYTIDGVSYAILEEYAGYREEGIAS